MRIGYARPLSFHQDIAQQLATLNDAGCERIIEEHCSFGRWQRPELDRLFQQLGKSDTIVVCTLDRLSTSLMDVLPLLEKINQAGAGFVSWAEDIDTISPPGNILMRIVRSFGDYERRLLRERTRFGQLAARAEGQIGGRRPKLTAPQQDEIIQLVISGKKTAAESARLFQVHPSTVARLLVRRQEASVP